MKTALGVLATILATGIYAVMFGCLIRETIISIKNRREKHERK